MTPQRLEMHNVAPVREDHLVGDTRMEKEEGCSVLGSAPLVPVGHNKDTEAPEPWRAETKKVLVVTSS